MDIGLYDVARRIILRKAVKWRKEEERIRNNGNVGPLLVQEEEAREV